MPSNFFSKLVKTAASTAHPADGSRTSSEQQRSRGPSVSVSSSASTISSGRPRSSTNPERERGAQSTDEDEETDVPSVTVVEPSPRSSHISSSAEDTPKAEQPFPPGLGTGNGGGDGVIDAKRSDGGPVGGRKRVPSALSQVGKGEPPKPGTMPVDEEGMMTPTPANRTTFQQSSRTLASSASQGELREKGRSHNHPRSATIATPSFQDAQADLQSISGRSDKSSKSKKSKSRDAPSRHNRSTSVPTVPPNISVTEDGMLVSPTRVDSPTDDGPSMRLLSASNTYPSVGSTLTVPKDNSDAASIRSVNSTASKRSRWRGKSNDSPQKNAAAAASSTSLSPARRKNTGNSLASALAASGMVMASGGMSVPPPLPTLDLPSNRPLPSRRDLDYPRTPPSAHSRRTSLSYPNSDFSDDRDSFHSGEDGQVGFTDEDDDLDLNPDDIPVTGFAVASNKRNQDFHELFPTIPEGDYLIEDYGCALQREILIQGRLYISENHVCFHANIFGWITDLCVPMYEVTSLDKRMTAFVIPNAIQVTTTTAKYTFASFLSRDTTFDVIYNVWRLARPEDVSSRAQSPRGSLDGPLSAASEDGASMAGNVMPTIGGSAVKVTRCLCTQTGGHLPEVAMESIIPGTPEKIYNLMFTSGFIKDFMRDDQKLLDIQISDWMPTAEPTLLARNMSYIKPLSGSIGPKQTKCEIRDETVHCDFDEYVTMLTTTRTPDVPSGNVFSVKTRTCITWASAVSTKVLVTTQVEWTGRSFIKGIIERSCIDGQKTYHADLEKAMRTYIHAHRSEFIPEGVDAEAVEESVANSPPHTEPEPAPGVWEARKSREYERDARGLQWAYDTFEGTAKVAKQSTEGAIELLKDAWDQSSSATILYGAIIFLVISNIWTLTMMGRKEEIGRRKEMKRMEEREKWVQGVVQTLWEELMTNRNSPPLGSWKPSESSGDWQDEVSEIENVLDGIEQRVTNIRESLKELD